MTSSNYAYANSVKESILRNKALFVDPIEDTTVIFEKSMDGGKSIADCLIFSAWHGVVGVEIKTARDSNKRLMGQLTSYSKVCDYVYILVHDKMLHKVQTIADMFPWVGIICYTELPDKLVLGKVREAQYNEHRDLHRTLEMLWKPEIKALLRHVMRELGRPMPHFPKSWYPKRDMINYLVKEAPGLTKETFVNSIIFGIHDPNKVVHHYDFL